MTAGDDGIFVESGSFRVDSARALEKIRDFQAGTDLPPELLWIRAANAAGAKTVRLKRTLREFTVRFDGNGLSRRFLEDPFVCLIDDRSVWTRYERHCARAILRELRDTPQFITVLSGTEGIDRRLSINGVLPEQRRLSKAPRDTDENEIRIRWPLWNSLRIARADSRFIEDRIGESRAEVVFEETSLSKAVAERREGLDDSRETGFRADGFRGRVRAAEATLWYNPALGSVLHPSFDGVSVADREFSKGPAAVEAWADSGRWGLNASMDALVDDEGLQAGLRAVHEATVALIRREIEIQRRRAARTGALLLERRESLEALTANGTLLTPEEALGRSEDLASLAVDLRRTVWLRHAAYRASRGPRVLQALLERTPLFWSVRGFPQSVRFLTRRNENFIRFDDKPWPSKRAAADIVWCLFGPEDRRWLKRLAGPRLRRAAA